MGLVLVGGEGGDAEAVVPRRHTREAKGRSNVTVYFSAGQLFVQACHKFALNPP